MAFSRLTSTTPYFGHAQGWCIQQQSRQLSDDNIGPRERYIVRYHEFAGDYPWNGAPAHLQQLL